MPPCDGGHLRQPRCDGGPGAAGSVGLLHGGMGGWCDGLMWVPVQVVKGEEGGLKSPLGCRVVLCPGLGFCLVADSCQSTAGRSRAVVLQAQLAIVCATGMLARCRQHWLPCTLPLLHSLRLLYWCCRCSHIVYSSFGRGCFSRAPAAALWPSAFRPRCEAGLGPRCRNRLLGCVLCVSMNVGGNGRCRCVSGAARRPTAAPSGVPRKFCAPCRNVERCSVPRCIMRCMYHHPALRRDALVQPCSTAMYAE
jgi:hypothetical protein